MHNYNIALIAGDGIGQRSRPLPHRHSGGPSRAAPRSIRCHGCFQPVRRHLVRPGAACTGTIGIAPSANLNPQREFPSMFEPVHGSAPDISGRNIANPIGQIWSGAMMLDHLGEAGAASLVVAAIEKVLQEGLRTADLGGSASTQEVGSAISEAVATMGHET